MRGRKRLSYRKCVAFSATTRIVFGLSVIFLRLSSHISEVEISKLRIYSELGKRFLIRSDLIRVDTTVQGVGNISAVLCVLKKCSPFPTPTSYEQDADEPGTRLQWTQWGMVGRSRLTQDV